MEPFLKLDQLTEKEGDLLKLDIDPTFTQLGYREVLKILDSMGKLQNFKKFKNLGFK